MKKRLTEILKRKLTKKELELLPSSYDIVGSILIFADFPYELNKKEKLIGEALLELHKNIKTICKKTRQYSGEYRLPKLKIIAGVKTKEATHKENNVFLKLNVEKTYFSPRSSTERKRIFSMIKKDERVLVMFSGIGPFPITISKNSPVKEVYSVEINPVAAKYQEENIFKNKIENIKLYSGDVNMVLPKLRKKFDHVLMPLPKSAEGFLEIAIKKAKHKGIVHFYDFLAEEDFSLAKEKIDKACKKLKKKYRVLGLVKCGQFSPRVFRICVDFKVF